MHGHFDSTSSLAYLLLLETYVVYVLQNDVIMTDRQKSPTIQAKFAVKNAAWSRCRATSKEPIKGKVCTAHGVVPVDGRDKRRQARGAELKPLRRIELSRIA